MKRKILSVLLAVFMLFNMAAPLSVLAANAANEDTEQSSDLLATATFAGSSWDWSGSGALSYDSNSTVTNGSDSLTSWRFSRTTAEGYTYPAMLIDFGNLQAAPQHRFDEEYAEI